MANEFYYPWYPAHYRRDAGHLDHVADSCYRRLLDWYMESGEPIKKDAAKLMHIMGCSAAQFQAVWPQIEGFFQLTPDGYLHHKRCNIELDRQFRKLHQRSEAGKRSAIKRNPQYQLLINDRSTDVQRPFNDRSERSFNDRYGNTAPNPITNQSLTNERSTSAAREERREDKNHKNGADAPPSLKSRIFGECLSWLAEGNGKDPDKYRAVVGKWVKDHGEIKTLEAFIDAQKINPVDPVSYITRILKPRQRGVPQI